MFFKRLVDKSLVDDLFDLGEGEVGVGGEGFGC